MVFWGSPSLQPGTHLLGPWAGSTMVSHLLPQHRPCRHSWERTRKGFLAFPCPWSSLIAAWKAKSVAGFIVSHCQRRAASSSFSASPWPASHYIWQTHWFQAFFCSPTLQYWCKCFHIGTHLWGRLESLLGYGHSGLSGNELSLISCGGRKRKERLSDVLSGSKSSLILNCYLQGLNVRSYQKEHNLGVWPPLFLCFLTF